MADARARTAPSVWPFGWSNVACFDHPLVFGPLTKQWGVYMRHREYRKTIELGIVLHGHAGGLLYDYMGSWFDKDWPDGYSELNDPLKATADGVNDGEA